MPITELENPIRNIQLRGSTLYVNYEGSTLQCYKNGANFWMPIRNNNVGAPIPPKPPITPPDPPSPGTGLGQGVVNWMVAHVGQFAYSQGAGRLTPLTSGYSDCSALAYFAYRQVTGLNIGTYTVAQYTKGNLVTQGSKTINLALLQPGDLIFFDWPNKGRTTVDHVEIYKGGDEMIGHGGPGKGPTIKSVTSRVSYAEKYFVRRHV